MRLVTSARDTREGGTVELGFPFARELVDDLKTETLARYRCRDPDERRWLILSVYVDTVIDRLTTHDPNVELPSDGVADVHGRIPAGCHFLPCRCLTVHPPREPISPSVIPWSSASSVPRTGSDTTGRCGWWRKPRLPWPSRSGLP
jgi:hypothetical protein